MLKNKIKKLIELIENTQIDEIEVSSFWGAQKIRLSKSKNNLSANIVDRHSSVNQDISEIELNNVENIEANSLKQEQVKNQNLNEITRDEEIVDSYEDESKFKIITAPLVGTFYSSPKPGDPSFVNVGDIVNNGMTVCIIEAMKIFNEIDSEFDGEVVEIYAKDGEPVEYGQELFVLRINNV